MRREGKTPGHSEGQRMCEITGPYCNKTYSVRRKLLMLLELAPLQGNRNTKICPKLEETDTTKQQWVAILLKINGNMPELRIQPGKFAYQLHPIRRITPAERRQRQKSTEEPTTKKDASGTRIPKQDQPTPKGQQQKTRTPGNQTQKKDFLHVPTRTNHGGKKTTQEKTGRPKTPKHATDQDKEHRNPKGGTRRNPQEEIAPMNKRQTAIHQS